MVVYNNALLGLGDWQQIAMACVMGLFAVWMMSIALVGWYQRHVNAIWRLLLAAAAMGCLMPVLWANVAALLVLGVFVLTQTTLLKKCSPVASLS
ncbi:hypothetical protein D3C80_1898710 [compost metagenome]